MNEQNELETQLRAWTPRGPSPGLRERIFRATEPALTSDQLCEEEPVPNHHWLAWLAPATAALLFAAVIFNQRNGPFMPGMTRSSPMVALALSNQSAAAFLPGSFSGEVNGPSAETFKWTNGSGSTSSISPLSGRRGMN